jgi:hypothetical protein
MFILEASGITAVFGYRTHLGYYDSQSGAAINAFLQSDDQAQTLLHINTDGAQRYSVMMVNR